MRDTPRASQSGTASTLITVWVALTMVIFLAACTSNGSSGGGSEAAPSVTTAIALLDRTTFLTDDVSMTPRSLVEDESANITFEASYEEGPLVVLPVQVKVGGFVDFEGWVVHIESIGPTEILWWAVGPSGQQIAGERVS